MKPTEKLKYLKLEINSNKTVAITSMGCVSPIGMNVVQNWDSLINRRHGLAAIQFLETFHQKDLFAGEVKHTNAELYQLLNIPLNQACTRTELLSRIAFQELCTHIEFSPQDPRLRTGFINSTTVGGMDSTEKFYDDYLISDRNRHFIPHHSSGYITLQLANLLGVIDYITTISTACSSAANAIMLGARMIRSGMLDRVIVGGVDSLSKFTVNGFNSLRIYSENFPKPFDQQRNGLNLGEAAAFLLLESEKSLSISKNKVLALVSGYGNANDAFHQTASSDEGDGALAAMTESMKIANLQPNQIDYINAHGTATPNNDLSEGRAFLRYFGSKENIPAFSSTKPYTGHTLAAAGSLEAVFSILAIQHQMLLPNLNFENPIEEIDLVPQLELQNRQITHVMSNSLGFGGNCSTIIFSKAN